MGQILTLTVGTTTRISNARQAGRALNHCQRCHRQLVRDQHTNLDSEFGLIDWDGLWLSFCDHGAVFDFGIGLDDGMPNFFGLEICK